MGGPGIVREERTEAEFGQLQPLANTEKQEDEKPQQARKLTLTFDMSGCRRW